VVLIEKWLLSSKEPAINFRRQALASLGMHVDSVTMEVLVSKVNNKV
jgi:hypothetical protein